MRLQDKVAVITGGGTGIGKGIAVRFAKEGAAVALLGRRMDVLEQTANEINQDGGKAIAVQMDVSDEQQVKNAVEKVKNEWEKIDILVNNAGIALITEAIKCTEDEWNKVLNIDLKGTWLMAKYCIPGMLEKGYGRIINIASIAGILGMNSCLAYGSAKGGVIEMTKVLAADYSGRGVIVNCIAPGYISTDMTAPFLASEEMKQGVYSLQLVKRIGEPEDIAAPAVYLASEEAGYITGQTIIVDGGYSVK